MRHLKAGRKFDRNASSRRAMFRNLAANLILHERIETTDAKAKELRRVAERLVTKAARLGKVAYTRPSELSESDKAKRLHATRQVGSFVGRFGTRTLPGGDYVRVDLVEKLFTDLAKRFEGRPGGYTRVIKLGARRGDGAQMAVIEWVVRNDPSAAAFSAEPAAEAAKAD
jgi:large subunit ribosomal protein L17